MSDFDALLFERDLEEMLGGDAPPPQLEGAIVAALEQAAVGGVPAAPRRRLRARRSRRSPASVAVTLALAAAVLAALALVLLTRETQPGGESGTATAPQDAPRPPRPQQRPEQPEDPEPLQSPPAIDTEPGTEPGGAPDTDSAPSEEPAPAPSDAEGPDAQPLPPEPTPGSDAEPPENPPAVASAPEPGAHSTARAVVGTLLAYTKRAGLRVRRGPDDSWSDPDGEALRSGTHLQAKRPVDVSLAGGGLLRFVGEIAIQTLEATDPSQAVGLTVSLGKRSTQAYVDALGVTAARQIALGDVVCEVSQACALVTHLGRLPEVLCFAGEVRAEAGSLGPGLKARLSVRGFSKPKRLSQKDRSAGVLVQAPARVLWREEFQRDLGDRLSVGAQEEGEGRCAGDGSRITVTFESPVKVLPGSRLRLRYWASNAGALYVQVTGVGGRPQFGKWIPLTPQKTWSELDLTLSELVRDEGGEPLPLSPGEELQNIQVIVQDGDRASLRVDLIELIRVHE